MCGIVAYAGGREAVDVLLQGLSRLEYRGYDSSGVCVESHGRLEIRKKAGRLEKLTQLLASQPVTGKVGISHTRWATHGEPNDTNAHPHTDQSGLLALVHNGVIENFSEIKTRLQGQGHTFQSQTDTEVLAHLVGEHYEKLDPSPDRLLQAVKDALLEVSGTYGVAVMHAAYPGEIVGARRGSPLILGVGQSECLLASDVTAVVQLTRDVIYLSDFDVVRIRAGQYEISSLHKEAIQRQVTRVDWDSESAARGQFPHFMLKEIFEQPSSLENALRGRLDPEECTAHLGGLPFTSMEARQLRRIQILACGSALHAAMTGEYIIEELARMPVECDFASEFRYRNTPMDDGTLALVVSQSGETADTLAAMREVQRKGFPAYGIVNTVGSTIARESNGGVYLHAGPEIGVAATKSFTSQTLVFVLLALHFGRMRHLSAPQGREMIDALQKLPSMVSEVLEESDRIREVAGKYCRARSMLFLGRQANYPIALEGALKLKEISYIHAEAFPSAELKHGIIALVEPGVPTLAICPQDTVYEKNLSNIQEVRARKGPIIALTTRGNKGIRAFAEDVIEVPHTHPCVQPILNAVALQLFSYHAAVQLGCDVDKPRNLAKSVTVE